MTEKLFLSLIPIYILYILALGIFMFRQRVAAVKSKQVSFKYFRSYQENAPEHLKVMQNHFSNQFEVPVLFFITCIAAVILNSATYLNFVLGCLFIISRIFHSFIHLGGNDVRLRAGSYFLGVFLVLGMWLGIFLF